VPDVRPFLERAAVVAVPVRMGGGTRLKVVEALATGKAIVSTRLGCEGVAVRDTEHLLVADDAQSFADRIVELFDDPVAGQALGDAGRRLVEAEYSWTQAAGTLEELYRCIRKTAKQTTMQDVTTSQFVIHDREGRAGAAL
jgi:glycosyltransferase involved in cell wall biosynthesis